MTITAGLDVGGAHLKVALAENGRIVAVRQFVCPLWQGLDKLDAALAEATPLTSRATRHAVTMTGELSDLFPDRQTGVRTLVARLVQEFGTETRFWMGLRGFGSAGDAVLIPADVGSTNFLATATLAARTFADALLVDFGSTTTDIIPILGGKPCPRGLTDAERQTTGELVYTGYTRTAVMGVTNRVPFKGQWVSLAREYLATMADVRRILGHNLDAADLHATADGKGKSLEESITRLARMLGRDAASATLDEWKLAAAFVAEEQARSIHDGIAQVISATAMPRNVPIITAGTGAFDISAIASRRLGRETVSFAMLANPAHGVHDEAEACAPAVSVAHLAADA